MAELKWIVENGADERLDKYLADAGDFSRSRIQQLLKIYPVVARIPRSFLKFHAGSSLQKPCL